MAITATHSTQKYRLLSGSHTANRRTYRSGVKDNDILELTEEQAKAFEKGRLRKLGEGEEGEGVQNQNGDETGNGNDSGNEHDDNLNTDFFK